MLSDRSYMRRDYPRHGTSATIWLVAALTAAFLLELILHSPWLGSSAGTIGKLALTVRSVQDGRLWTLLTHCIVHRTENPLHIVTMLLGLVLVGRELEPLLGARRLLAVFAGATVAGGLSWTAAHWSTGGMHLGASAGVLGLFVVLARLCADEKITFLFLLAFPVTLRPRFFVIALLAVDACGLIFYELQGVDAPFGLAPSAHFGGMLAGWAYTRLMHANNGWDRAEGLRIPAWLRRRAAGDGLEPPPVAGSSLGERDLRAEVDRILDKINSEGFGALTDREKDVLDEAKDMLSKR